MSELVWQLEKKYGPVMPRVIDQVAVAHQLATVDLPTAAAIRRAFKVAGVESPTKAYVVELAGMLARRVKRPSILDLLIDFRQYAIGALSRRFGGMTKGREDELRDYLRTFLVPRGYAEAEAGKGNTDLLIPSVPAIIETKVWESRQVHEDGLEQLRRYIHSEKPKEAYLVVFGDRDPLPRIIDDHEQAVADRPVLSGLSVPVVVVPFEVDYPSKAGAVARKRARNGRS